MSKEQDESWMSQPGAVPEQRRRWPRERKHRHSRGVIVGAAGVIEEDGSMFLGARINDTGQIVESCK